MAQFIAGIKAQSRIRIEAYLVCGWDQGQTGALPHVTYGCACLPQVPRTPRPAMESADSRRLATKHSRKALKASLTLGILLGMFFVTWLPFFVANIAQVMPPQGAGGSRPGWGGPDLHPSPDMRIRGGWAASRGIGVCGASPIHAGWGGL